MNSNIKNTIIATTTAALLIGGGTGIYSLIENNDTEQNIIELKINDPIDWSMFDLSIPAVNVPKVEIPKINIPSIIIPEVKSSIEIASIDIELFKTEKRKSNNDESFLNLKELFPKEEKIISSPINNSNSINIQSPVKNEEVVENPINNKNDVNIQAPVKNEQLTENLINNNNSINIQSPVKNEEIAENPINNDVNIQSPVKNEEIAENPINNIKTLNTSYFKEVKLDYPKLILTQNNKFNFQNLNDRFNLNEIKNYEESLKEWAEFIKNTWNLFKDQRSLNSGKTFDKIDKISNEWIEIYKIYENKEPIKYIEIKNKFRMISEVRPITIYRELNILTKNLEYYKSEGYDSVLVAFDKDDSLENILNTILYIKKYCGMNVWLTYTGDEKLSISVFMDKTKYEKILLSCAPYISGYVNSWRRTSAHLFEQDNAFMNFTNYTLRSVNPNLPIISELYYGNSHRYHEEDKVGFTLNNFQNSSGIMVVNFGFNRIDFNYLFNEVLKPYLQNSPKIGCVVGQKPYYMTKNDNHLSYKDNMKIKHKIEDNFFKYGCIGTITLSNDGKEAETNNISITPYETLQGSFK